VKAPLHLVTGDEAPTPLDRAQADGRRATQSRRSAFAAVVEAMCHAAGEAAAAASLGPEDGAWRDRCRRLGEHVAREAEALNEMLRRMEESR
jgi:hypothetical protein